MPLLVLTLMAVGASPADASTFTVTKLTDTADGVCDSDCSLREAISAANSAPGADTVLVPGSRTRSSEDYTLTIAGADEEANATGDLDVTDDLTIVGTGPTLTIVNADRLDRVIDNSFGVELTLQSVVVHNGFAAGGGGGVRNAGTLTVQDSIIAAHASAGDGGGILNLPDGALTLVNSFVSDNSAANDGGGVYNLGTLSIENSTIRQNTASTSPDSSGGGLFNTGSATIFGSTISGNSATFDGGGINNNPPTESIVGSPSLTMTNSTISGNTAGIGGAIHSAVGGGQATVSLTNVTIAHNVATFNGGGIANGANSTANLRNTIVANSVGADCTGAIASQGHNLDSDSTCVLTATGDLPDHDPVLGPLAENHGPILSPTHTHALLSGSAAIDAGDDAVCPAADQRGLARPQDGDGNGNAVCDIGAFEAEPAPAPTATPATPTPTASPEAGPAALPPTGSARGSDGAWPLFLGMALAPILALALWAGHVRWRFRR